MRAGLAPLLARATACTAEFMRLQRGYPDPDEIERDIAYRERALRALWAVLENQGRSD